jgi:hypothetical protein
VPPVKPQDHREICIITHETSYEVAPGDVKGTHASSGTLFRGRVVWTQKTPGAYADGEKVSPYAEGVGIVMLERAGISPAR